MKKKFTFIYKIFLIKIFSLFNKPIKVLYDNNKIKENINKIKINDIIIYQINNGKIFTTSVDDAAYLFKDKLIIEPSYQYRNSFNSHIKNNFVLKKGTPKFLKKIRGNVVSLLSGGAAKTNYGHWMFDVISRYFLFKKKKLLKKNAYYYVPAYKFNYQKETLRYLGIKDEKIISSEKYKYIQGEEILCTTHPFNHRFSQIPKVIIRDLRLNFLSLKNKSNIRTHKRIFINRDYSKVNFSNLKEYKNERILANHHEVKNFLQKKNFYEFKLLNMSVADQIKIFSEANIIISMYGAELSNLVFCKPQTQVIELKNLNKSFDFLNLSKNSSLKHNQINIMPLFKSKVYQNGVMICPITQLDPLLRKRGI